MQNTSLLTRLLTAVLVVAVIGMFVKIMSFRSGQRPAPTPLVVDSTARPAAAADAQPASAPHPEQTFNYTPLKPVGGKLRGVVELGASGFNSFIVRTDAHHNWQLNKAEYDNSLIMENMASDEDIRRGLRAYITKMLDYGVAGRDIHFVVSSGALKVLATHRIVEQLAHMHYVVNTMTPAKEAALGLSVALPPLFGDRAFVVDIGSGGTEISWQQQGKSESVDTYGSKYYEHGVTDEVVALDVKHRAEQVPANLRQTCFIMGGVPFEMAKQVRKGKERYTVLSSPEAYQFESAKGKSGAVIYQAIAQATGCQKFIFDWDANFTIGYLLSLPQ